jgi:hypothetical protein
VGLGGWWGEEVAQTMYTHVSKYKNDKIKEEKNTATYNIIEKNEVYSDNLSTYV